MSERVDHEETRSLVEQLGLEDGDGRWFYGLHGGYAVAVRGDFSTSVPELRLLMPTLTADSPIPSGLMFQIRHALEGEAVPRVETIEWSSRLQQMMNERAIEIIIDDRIAWLDIDKPEKIPAGATVVDLLDDVLLGLDGAGVNGAGTACHYCGEREVEHLTFSDGRVAQICAECFSAKVDDAHGSLAPVPGASRRCALVALLTSVASGVLWGVSWVLFDVLIAAFAGVSGSVSVPRLALLLIALVFVCVLAGPPVLAVRSIRGRGDLSAGLLSAAAVVGGALLGEALHVTWLAYGWTGQIAPLQAVSNIGFVWSLQSSSVLTIKLLSAVVAAFVAFCATRQFGKPLVL